MPRSDTPFRYKLCEVIQSHVFGSRRHAFDARVYTLRWTEAMFEASCDYQMRFGFALCEDIARKE